VSVFIVDKADLGMKRVMTYLFSGLFGVFLAIMYLANSIV
jgi:hypothetical protein